MKYNSSLLKTAIWVLLVLSMVICLAGCGNKEVVPEIEMPKYETTTKLSGSETGVFVGEITGRGTCCALQLDEIINYSNEDGFECATTAIAFSRTDSLEFADKVGGVFAIRGSVSAYRGYEHLMFYEYEILDTIDLTNAHFEPMLKGEWDLMDSEMKAQSALLLMDYLLTSSDYFDSVRLLFSYGTVEDLQGSDMAVKFTPSVSLNGIDMNFTQAGSDVGAVLNVFVTRNGVEFLINNTRSWKYSWDGSLDRENSENTEGQDFSTYVRDFYISETTVQSPNVQISEDDAYRIALKHWDYNPGDTDPRTGKEVVIEKMGIVSAYADTYYYLFRMYTIDHIFIKSAYIDVEDGSYYPDVLNAEM